MRTAILAVLLCLGASAPTPAQEPEDETRIAVTAAALPLVPNRRYERSVGRLQYTGGITLASTDAHFGGLSGLIVSPDGKRFLAISDRGHWLCGRLVHERDELVGIADVRRAPMLDWRGKVLSLGEHDAEGLARMGDALAVSFERFHRIWRYALPDPEFYESVFARVSRAIEKLPEIEDLPSNGGIEALAGLPDGRLLAISEEGRAGENRAKAWLIGPEGVVELSFRLIDDFRPTDAAALPNGDVVVLERRFNLVNGPAARLRLVPAHMIAAGEVMDGDTLATLQSPVVVDNMEGLAVIPAGNGYRLFLVSDDNFNPLQRTILLSFLWEETSP